jgi:hypothetical protein
MANLIDASYFIGEINIPNTQKTEIQESLDWFISKYEQELLQKLLGWELWSLYNADASSQRFVDLINGTDYVYGGYIYHWRGLIWKAGENPHSLIANYIYWYWMKDKQIWNSGIGTIKATPIQGVVMSPGLKMVHVWNDFAEQVKEFYNYMTWSSVLYPEWNANNVFSLWEFAGTNDFDI